MVNENLINFCSNYFVLNSKLKKRSKSVIVKTYPYLTCSPKNELYPTFCKYQLIKYKPWSIVIENAWDNATYDDTMFCEKWQFFLESEIGHVLVPQWKRELHNVESYFTNMDPTDDYEILDLTEQREDWMHISDMCQSLKTYFDTDGMQGNNDYWNSFRDNYTSEEINAIPFWLTEQKKVLQTIDIAMNVDFDSLNKHQKQAFDIIYNHMQYSEEQLLMIITGEAGTGKSFLISCIKQLLQNLCSITAYFGIAAFNVKGKTLHSLLQLPIKGRYLHDLKGPSLLRLQESMSGIKYILIDEFSVVGQKLLGWIDKRCRQATGNHCQPFGGLSVILVGDIAQLPPVCDKPLFHRKPDTDVGTQGYCVYNSFQCVVRLTKNERAKGDNQGQNDFRKTLSNLRNGACTVSDWQRILSRTVLNVKPSDTTEYVKLAFSNETVASQNSEALKQLNKPVAIIKAHNNSKEASSASVDDMGGLTPILYLCKEARVMLTRNLWTEKGLCNGSMGYVKDIIYKHGDYPPSLPIGVLVQFDETYIGPSFHKVLPRYVPVLPVTSCCNLITTCERMQMPLKLAWSITIHKSQGLTLSKAWVDLGKRECFAGLTYVAISRVRKLEDLLVEPMSLDRLNAVKHCPSFTYRQIEEKRLQSLAPCKNMAVSENKLKL